MIVCKVVGHIWATKKEERLEGLKLMVVQEEGGPGRKTYVAADVVGAGIGERVLVVSASTARGVFTRENVPADMAIVGIVDDLEIEKTGRRPKTGEVERNGHPG